MAKVITDRSLFASLRELNIILKEIVSATKILEINNDSIGMLWITIIQLFKTLNDLDVAGKFQVIVRKLLGCLNETKKLVLEHEIFFIAFFLQPKYRAIAVSSYYKFETAQDGIAQYAIDCGFGQEETVVVFKECENYLKGKYPYNFNADE